MAARRRGRSVDVMTDRLSALDATFLELEQADASAHMHIGAVLVFAPRPDGSVPTLDDIRHRLALRLDALPRYRQRLSEPKVGGLRWPAWEPDPAFALDHHVRRAALPGAGSAPDLLDWAGDFYAHRLDRSRPLWEIVLLEGLADGRWALCTKTHHCMVDGIGAIDAGLVLLDATPDAADAADRGPWPAMPGRPPVRSRGLRAPVRAGASALAHPDRVVRRSAALAELLVRDEIIPAPRCSLNVPMGKHRRLAAVGLPLADLKAIKAALGGTINDVVLAAVSAGLRALLVGRGERPVRLRAMVPVNVRSAHDRGSLGNRISSLFIDLPVDQADPIAAYEAVRHTTARDKQAGQAVGSSTLLDVAALAPPVLHAVVSQSLYATRLFNLTVTNVPGPQTPLYAFGARLADAFPLVPLAAEHALGVAVLSFDGQVVFGLNCDRDAVPDVGVMADGIREGIDRLRRVAEGAASPIASASP
jgi:diacylglycerol O-acyltransferase / wax synthase